MNKKINSLAYKNQEIAFQVALMSVSMLLHEAENQVLDANDGKIESNIKKDMLKLVNDHYADLKIIFSSDPKLMRELMREAYEISSDYAGRFNDDFTNAAKTVVPAATRSFGKMATVTALGMTTAASVTTGMIKVTEATDDFASKFGNRIHEKAASQHPTVLINDEQMAGKLAEFSETLSKLLFGQVKGMISSDILGPLANFGGSFFGSYIQGALHNHFKALEHTKMLEQEAKKVYVPKVKINTEFEVVGGEWKDPDSKATPLEKRALADKDLTVKWENGLYSFYDAANNPVHLESWFKMKDATINEPITSKRAANDYEKISNNCQNIICQWSLIGHFIIELFLKILTNKGEMLVSPARFERATL